MSKYIFECVHKNMDGTEAGSTKTELEDVTWTAISDQFYHFLLGCGFVLTRSDLSDHFWEPDDDEREGKEL